jgi:glutamate-1-semialdehyde aminotransferase
MRIFGGASTFSKMSCNYPDGYPERMSYGENQYLVDENGVKWFDTVSALGAQLNQYSEGTMMSLPYIGERVLADLLHEKMPFIEMVRYGCNGADATEGAIRYARNFTGRDEIYSVGYHSCQSAFTYNTSPALGCIDGRVFQYDGLREVINELEDMDEHFHSVAAVITEPVILDITVYPLLAKLRELTSKLGIVLIFDEIITGFRFPKFCVSNFFDISPDLILLGKGLANGHPLSVIGGKKEIMDCPVFHSYTFAGYPSAIFEAIKTCSITPQKMMDFWERGGLFIKEVNELPYDLKLIGYNTRMVWDGPIELVYILWQQMAKKHILLGPVLFPRIGWTENDWGRLYYTILQTLQKIKIDDIKLDGPVPEPIFKRNKS